MYAEFIRGFCFISHVSLQCFLYDFLFAFGDGGDAVSIDAAVDNVLGQMGRPNVLFMAHHKGMLYGVFKFAHIAGEGISAQQAHHFRRNPLHRTMSLFPENFKKMVYQQGNILGPILKRRDFQVNDIDPLV